MVKGKTQRRLREFCVGDAVFVRHYGDGKRWLRGSIIEVHGSKHYIVSVQGRHLQSHVDHIIKSGQKITTDSDSSSADPVELSVPDPEIPDLPSVTSPRVPDSVVPGLPLVTTPADTTPVAAERASSDQSPNAEKGSEKLVLSESAQDKDNSGDAVLSAERRYPARVRNPPNYLKDYER